MVDTNTILSTDSNKYINYTKEVNLVQGGSRAEILCINITIKLPNMAMTEISNENMGDHEQWYIVGIHNSR
jgi:hypothetical protein